jgi:precorrin-2 dehydrogenase/sirohydrochlorin ferrochelatase
VSGYPIFLELQDRLVVVVGGGAVGRRKAAGLLAAGARVRLISRDPVPPTCWTTPIDLHLRPFHPADLDGAVLAFAATGIAETDQAVLAAARERGIPANLAAAPEAGDFTVPAVLRRGDLVVAVSTSTQAPALAGVVRDQVAAALGPEWALVVAIAARLRTGKLTGRDETVYSSKVLADLLDGGLAELLANGCREEIDHLLTRTCGRDITLAGLGLTLPDHTP